MQNADFNTESALTHGVLMMTITGSAFS